MKIDYTLLALILSAAYAALKLWLPDFPVTEQVLVGFIVYVLAKLGVVVVGAPLRRFLAKFARG